MRGGKLESFGSVSQKQKLTIRSLAWPNGAILTCRLCLFRTEKTAEEMEKYLNKWPSCCDAPVDVRPK